MEEKAQETQVSLSTLAATNGYMANVFLTAKLYIYDFDKEWVEIDSMKPSNVPGNVIVVRADTFQEIEVDATYMFGLRLV